MMRLRPDSAELLDDGSLESDLTCHLGDDAFLKAARYCA